MPDGQLLLQVRDVNGAPVTEPVDIFMRNQTLADAPALRQADVSNNGKVLTGLNVFPNGNYSIEIDALSYHTVSRFVSIPPDGKGAVGITLPVNPKKVLRVDFPAYSAILPDARSLLERSSNMMNFKDKKGEELYNALDDLRKAAFLNLTTKADRTRFTMQQGPPRSVLSFIEEITELRQDRFFASIPEELRSETISNGNGTIFHEVSELLHTPPAQFTRARSFKTLDHFGNLQLSFFSSPDGRFAVDMDIDDAQGFDHVFQVVGNLFGGPTHPYNIHEILIATQELDPGYRLIIQEARATHA
jgi:hypothetical protein